MTRGIKLEWGRSIWQMLAIALGLFVLAGAARAGQHRHR